LIIVGRRESNGLGEALWTNMMGDNPAAEPRFLALARTRGVVMSALKVALVVGSILALINHGRDIFTLNLTPGSVSQILLTYMVPYIVSTYSSVRALQRHALEHPDKP
jgi:hypothetical protein